MTNKEIVQALRACASGEAEDCPFTAVDGCDGCPKVSADLIERLTAENAALREKVPQWISVEERRPEKQAWYHVAIRDKKTMRVYVELDFYAVGTAKNFGHEIGFCKANRWPEREELIAWMPLPEAPEEGDKA